MTWSEVSVNSNADENFSYSRELGVNFIESLNFLLAAVLIKSSAISFIFFLREAFFCCQLLNPSLSSWTLLSLKPYFEINSRLDTGINNLSLLK